MNKGAGQDVGKTKGRLLDMDFSCQSDEDFSPVAVDIAALDSENETNNKISEINFDPEPIASTSYQSEGITMDRSKKRRLFDSDEIDNTRLNSPKKRSKSGDDASTSVIVDIESLGKVRSPLSDIEDYTESNMADTQFAGSTNNIMQDVNKKPMKTKAQELLAKLKQKRDRFKTRESVQRETTSLQTVGENENDAGPSSHSSHRTEAEQTNDNIEGYIARCKEVVCKLKDSFNSQQSLSNNPRIIQWKKEAEELDAKIKLPQTVIAVVGDTGCGKSSLMNALIDQLDVLPTSGVRACTAVVVEIRDNKLNDMFQADVQFLSKKEWHDELKLLLTDLTGADGKIKKNVPDPQSEAGVAYLKIKAVYGRIDTFEVLSRCNTVTRWLDSTKTISSGNAKEFRRAIDKYIETADPGSGGQYWPIVKLVTMRIPNCDVCSSGAVLVDLPGVRDSNAARDKIARDYLKKCTTVWVVSSIHRAIDDKTAKDLLGENFRRQLLMDGQYGSIAFICTKSDILVPSEIIQGLKLHAQTDPLENEIQGLLMEKADADLLVANADSDMTWMGRHVEKLENEISELKGDLQDLQNLQDLNDSMDQDDSCEIQQQIKEFKEIITSKEEAVKATESDMKEKKLAKDDAYRRVCVNIHGSQVGVLSYNLSIY
ncbi:hypothetical protein KUTeg_019335 [Tegillarca granosa]|uniref:Dynamin N-terminal domain-containing protein n=1 Tax=Tegillarca granosa TaxID=220873 RepID=A0ABQ9EEB5_TEGGR|nr:hypothetical protein KUTeg_019335 [Tegillarca granosa]